MVPVRFAEAVPFEAPVDSVLVAASAAVAAFTAAVADSTAVAAVGTGKIHKIQQSSSSGRHAPAGFFAILLGPFVADSKKSKRLADLGRFGDTEKISNTLQFQQAVFNSVFSNSVF